MDGAIGGPGKMKAALEYVSKLPWSRCSQVETTLTARKRGQSLLSIPFCSLRYRSWFGIHRVNCSPPLLASQTDGAEVSTWWLQKDPAGRHLNQSPRQLIVQFVEHAGKLKSTKLADPAKQCGPVPPRACRREDAR